MRNSLTPANAKADHSQQKGAERKSHISKRATVSEEEEGSCTTSRHTGTKIKIYDSHHSYRNGADLTQEKFAEEEESVVMNVYNTDIMSAE